MCELSYSCHGPHSEKTYLPLLKKIAFLLITSFLVNWMIKSWINWKYIVLIITNFDQNHISQEIQQTFPSKFSKSSRTFKNKIQQNSFKSSSIRVIPFASFSNHLPLKLFWQLASRNSTNLHCSKCVHPWHFANSSTRSKFELT
jgi:hypothetical protein